LEGETITEGLILLGISRGTNQDVPQSHQAGVSILAYCLMRNHIHLMGRGLSIDN